MRRAGASSDRSPRKMSMLLWRWGPVRLARAWRVSLCETNISIHAQSQSACLSLGPTTSPTSPLFIARSFPYAYIQQASHALKRHTRASLASALDCWKDLACEASLRIAAAEAFRRNALQVFQ